MFLEADGASTFLLERSGKKKKSTGSTILTYLKKSNSGLIQPNMAELFFQGVEGHITS